MKQRAAAPAREPEKKNTDGMTFFQIAGIVQDVTRNDKMLCDYVRFNIRCKEKPEYYDIISVTVMDTVGVMCEPGDALVMRGYMRSWQRNGGITLEMVAVQVQPIDPAQLKRGGAVK